MNKLLIIAKNANTFFIDRMRAEASLRLIGLDIVNPWEVKDFTPHEASVLVRSTAIHGTDHDLEFIRQKDLKTLPSLRALELLRTKPKQFSYFQKLAIGHIPWLDLQSSDVPEIQNFSSDKGKLLIKPQRGQGGWGVRVFDSASDLIKWWSKSSDREYLLQPYLEEHDEIRVFFMKETYIALKRIKKGVAANFRQDGEAQLIDVPADLKKVIDKIRQNLDLIYGAADFLIDPKGTPYLLEMNLVPGIEQLEQVSGRNIAGELLEIFLNP